MPKMPNGGPELALTFDDVLLQPGLSEVHAGRGRYPHAASPATSRSTSRSSPPRWTR